MMTAPFKTEIICTQETDAIETYVCVCVCVSVCGRGVSACVHVRAQKQLT